MVLEVANIDVVPGKEAEFITAYQSQVHQVSEVEGCRSVRMTRGIESPSRFVLLVEWDSVKAHDEGFRGTERFTRWRQAIGPFFAAPPHVEHFNDVPATG
jgi:heme-degrading monooxygenase HmoA